MCHAPKPSDEELIHESLLREVPKWCLLRVPSPVSSIFGKSPSGSSCFLVGLLPVEAPSLLLRLPHALGLGALLLGGRLSQQLSGNWL